MQNEKRTRAGEQKREAHRERVQPRSGQRRVGAGEEFLVLLKHTTVRTSGCNGFEAGAADSIGNKLACDAVARRATGGEASGMGAVQEAGAEQDAACEV